MTIIHRPEFLSSEERELLEDNAAAFALDALEPTEAFSYRDHLAGCALCQGMVAEYSDTVGLLTIDAGVLDSTTRRP